ncbi:LysR family transcriptional regulator [Euhalothece natronophila Z-M001]|uniref:LysR family transcriptional regulator n=1 Tax=Euhalothece natronophila Z-M001 TaxID=522448 RepID=A0A5B8NLD4_9CHRO|nr:LysR family transcriptional regulator [Euhalothece natronophila]QDZ39090.1 LysR family transcriptional regulator [Euhalothece natronophila Z-M001]
MRIEQLQAFLAITETGNFGQAAKKCSVTQSTISRQVQGLENTLGVDLFHRSHQAKLTVAGERLLPRARKICQEWAMITQELHDLMAGKQPELCVAAIHSVCSYHLPPILQVFSRQYPHVQLRVTALGSDRALKVLRDGLVDVAIVMNNPAFTTNPEMVTDILFEEPIEVLMAANHPLTQYNQLGWSELASYPHVVFKDGYGMQRLVQDWFSQQNAPIKMAMELNTLDAFRGVIRQGELIALLPHSALVEAQEDPTLAIGRIENHQTQETLTRQVVFATTRDRAEIPPIKAFRQMVQKLSVSDKMSTPLSVY